MQQFILVKSSKDAYEQIIVVLKMLLGNSIDSNIVDDILIVKNQAHDSKEIYDTLKSLESDLNVAISVYVSYASEDIDTELNLVLKYFKIVESGNYNLKSLLFSTKQFVDKTAIFKFITNGSGVDENIVMAMALNDLNVSKASNLLYMHRNTLLYKIDRLIDLKDFDLKKFVDLMILVRLLKA